MSKFPESVLEEIAASDDSIHSMRYELERIALLSYQLGRKEGLEELIAKLEAIGPAHTYASENADLYRGYDNGIAGAISIARSLTVAEQNRNKRKPGTA